MKAGSCQKIVQGFTELSQNLLEGIVCVFLIAALANMPVLARVRRSTNSQGKKCKIMPLRCSVSVSQLCDSDGFRSCLLRRHLGGFLLLLYGQNMSFERKSKSYKLVEISADCRFLSKIFSDLEWMVNVFLFLMCLIP